MDQRPSIFIYYVHILLHLAVVLAVYEENIMYDVIIITIVRTCSEKCVSIYFFFNAFRLVPV